MSDHEGRVTWDDSEQDPEEWSESGYDQTRKESTPCSSRPSQNPHFFFQHLLNPVPGDEDKGDRHAKLLRDLGAGAVFQGGHPESLPCGRLDAVLDPPHRQGDHLAVERVFYSPFQVGQRVAGIDDRIEVIGGLDRAGPAGRDKIVAGVMSDGLQPGPEAAPGRIETCSWPSAA